MIRKNGTTLDFVVKDNDGLMALLLVLGRKVFGQVGNSFMGLYTKLKFKMKLSYECW